MAADKKTKQKKQVSKPKSKVESTGGCGGMNSIDDLKKKVGEITGTGMIAHDNDEIIYRIIGVLEDILEYIGGDNKHENLDSEFAETDVGEPGRT